MTMGTSTRAPFRSLAGLAVTLACLTAAEAQISAVFRKYRPPPTFEVYVHEKLNTLERTLISRTDFLSGFIPGFIDLQNSFLHLVQEFTQASNFSEVNGDLRLQDGDEPASSGTGRVEVYLNGVWGTICADTAYLANNNSADVLCTYLGFSGGQPVSDTATYGEGSGIIWVTGLTCLGSESNITECAYDDSTPGLNSCLHSMDAGVICDDA